MTDCIILGDSIAVGIASALMSMGVTCDVRAGIGWPTELITREAVMSAHRTAIVSAGSNDMPGQRLAELLGALRRKVNATRVIWIYPYSNDRASQVYNVAQIHGDSTIDFFKIGSRDGVHPRNYFALAYKIRYSMNYALEPASPTHAP